MKISAHNGIWTRRCINPKSQQYCHYQVKCKEFLRKFLWHVPKQMNPLFKSGSPNATMQRIGSDLRTLFDTVCLTLRHARMNGLERSCHVELFLINEFASEHQPKRKRHLPKRWKILNMLLLF